MIPVFIRKGLFNGLIDISNKDYEKALRENQTIEVTVNGLVEKMTLNPNELVDNKLGESIWYKDKRGGADYKLYQYHWKPNS